MLLEHYNDDGAHRMSQAILHILSCIMTEDVSKELQVSRWHNCREQGYIASLYKNGKQLNIAWFEHRNSDMQNAVKWEQVDLNPITISNAVFGDVYKDKWDTSFQVPFDEPMEMAKWISDEFAEWFENN
jgi:hypothetical protein